MKERVIVASLFTLWLGCLQAGANDRWEGAGLYGDDGYVTTNVLVHPTTQWAHDLEGVPGDQDWSLTRTSARRSYEARVRSSSIFFHDAAGCGGTCPSFDRVDSAGTVITAGQMDGPFMQDGNDNVGTTLAVRWIAAADATELLRVSGNQVWGAGNQYDLEFCETTVFAPRFNNSATQRTVMILQNTTSAPLTGSAYFYDASGTLLHTEPISMAGRGGLVLNTSTIGALQGQSGHLTIAHLGPYGALSGKLVALEPATGFTFDTPVAPLPR